MGKKKDTPFSFMKDWAEGKVKFSKIVKESVKTNRATPSQSNNRTSGNDKPSGTSKTSGNTKLPPLGSTGGGKTTSSKTQSAGTNNNASNSVYSSGGGGFAPMIGNLKGGKSGSVGKGQYGFGSAGSRVIIKANFLRGIQRATAHLNYIEHRQYDEKSELFNSAKDGVNRNWFTDQLNRYDVVHRIVISPEDKNVDLKELVRETMEQFAKKKDRDLTWIAAIHKNKEHTSHPHVHLVLSGVDKGGNKVRIEMPDIEYLKQTTSEYVARELNLFKEIGSFFFKKEQEKELEKNREKDQGVER